MTTADMITICLTENLDALRERLIAGYQSNASADAALAAEWAPIEEETWLRLVPAYDAEEAGHHNTTAPEVDP